MLTFSMELCKMIKAFIAFRIRRIFLYRQHRVKFHRYQQSIDHFILCTTRVDAQTLNVNFCTCGIEVFIIHAIDLSTVNRICKIGTEFRNTEMIRSPAYLFIRSKCQTDFSMLTVFLKQRFRHRHDFRDSRLVISTQQRRSICHDQILADFFLQACKIMDSHFDTQCFIQHNIGPVIGFDYSRLYISAAHIR